MIAITSGMTILIWLGSIWLGLNIIALFLLLGSYLYHLHSSKHSWHYTYHQHHAERQCVKCGLTQSRYDAQPWPAKDQTHCGTI